MTILCVAFVQFSHIQLHNSWTVPRFQPCFSESLQLIPATADRHTGGMFVVVCCCIAGLLCLFFLTIED